MTFSNCLIVLLAIIKEISIFFLKKSDFLNHIQVDVSRGKAYFASAGAIILYMKA